MGPWAVASHPMVVAGSGFGLGLWTPGVEDLRSSAVQLKEAAVLPVRRRAQIMMALQRRRLIVGAPGDS